MTKEKYSFINKDKIKSVLFSSVGYLLKTPKSPEELLGSLFFDVRQKNIYKDGKLIVDLVPKFQIKQIEQEYELSKGDSDFDLSDFIDKNFYELNPKKLIDQTNTSLMPREYINGLWDKLEFKYRQNKGSLIALPYSYIVPGGRFSEQFYWDSYFIMLGLAADNRWDMVENMIKNIAFMIRKFGFIPTANRTYFLSRSQPPFFSQMVKLLAEHKGKMTLVEYLPYMVMEHKFWMNDTKKLRDDNKHDALNRVVLMPDSSVLNRYYDKKTEPREELFTSDSMMANGLDEQKSDVMFLHLRACAESGWDFSSRWFYEAQDIKTISTANMIPVDLNCLLYHLESTIVEAYGIIKQSIPANIYKRYADNRKKSIQNYCWNNQKGFYFDYDFLQHDITGRFTLAALYPMYTKIATSDQAKLIVKHLEDDFLKEGGLVATLIQTDQQWDSPNGWAPLHWVAIVGLRNYGYNDLADNIKKRWINTNLNYFKKHGKFVEKYNVINPEASAAGGEYELQDGFGWTNGVFAALISEDSDKILKS